MKKIVLLLTALCLALVIGLFAAPAAAGPPEQIAVVPAEAQWALFIDVQKLMTSSLFKSLGGESQLVKIQGKTDPIFAKLRIDPKKDLKGVTVFGLGKKDEEAVVALSGKFDKAHLISLVEAETTHQEIPFGKYTIYKWNDDELGVFAADDLVILGENEMAIKSALEALEGRSRDSVPPLLSRVMKDSPNALMVFSVNNVPSLIGEHDSPVILSKMKGAEGSIGESGENLKLDVSILAESAQVAKDVEQAIRGLIAIANLQLKESETQAFIDAVQIAVDGQNVRIKAAYPLNKLLGLVHSKAKDLSFF
jgi:hypothetical protein